MTVDASAAEPEADEADEAAGLKFSEDDAAKKVKLDKKKYSKKFIVNKSTGKITVKKGLKKGVYKLTVKIKAAGDRHYASKTKNVRVTIRVK